MKFVRFLSLMIALSMTLAAGAWTDPTAQDINAATFTSLKAFQRAHSSSTLNTLRAALTTRSSTMLTLMDSNPGLVLAAALPANVWSQIPTSMQYLLEKNQTLQGTAEVAIEDGPIGNAYTITHYGILVAGRHISLHFSGAEPAGWMQGTSIQVTGVAIGTSVAATVDNTSILE